MQGVRADMFCMRGQHSESQRAPRQRGGTRRAAAATSSEQAAFTWCNPTDAVVRQVRENVWVGDRPFVWNGIDVGGRMTFLKLKDGSLMAFSPLQLDDEMRQALESIGPVKHIVVRLCYVCRVLSSLCSLHAIRILTNELHVLQINAVRMLAFRPVFCLQLAC